MRRVTLGALVALLLIAVSTGAWAALDQISVVRPAGMDDWAVQHSHAQFVTTSGSTDYYKDVTGDWLTGSYAYGAKVGGGLERWGFTVNGITTDYINNKIYHSVARNPNTGISLFAAHASGLDKITWNGSWVTTTVTTNVYKEITPDPYTGAIYGIRADGSGADRILSGGAVEHLTDLNFVSIVGGGRLIDTQDRNVFFGTLATGGVVRIKYDGGWKASNYGVDMNTVYSSITCDAGGSWLYGARADGTGLDRLYIGVTEHLNTVNYAALIHDRAWQQVVYGARADGGVDRVWFDHDLQGQTGEIVWHTDTIATGRTYSSFDFAASSGGSNGVIFAASAVPEPGALLALSSGLIGLAGLKLRRRK